MADLRKMASDWEKVAAIALAQLAPGAAGVVLTRADMAALPVDRVLVVDEFPDRLEYRWLTPAQAQRIRDRSPGTTGVSRLEGRWDKLVAVLLWKLAEKGFTIRPGAWAAVPADQTLLIRGFREHVELRFVPLAEAQAMDAWEKEYEGKIITETIR